MMIIINKISIYFKFYMYGGKFNCENISRPPMGGICSLCKIYLYIPPTCFIQNKWKKGLGRYKNFEKMLFSFQMRLATVLQ